jgi:hypothetical protein
MRRTVWIPLARFWKSDESLSILLVLLIVVTLILPAVMPRLGSPGPTAVALFSAMLFAGAATIWRNDHWIVRAVAVLCVLAVPGQWLRAWSPSIALAAWNAATEAIVCVLLAIVVLTTVLRAGTITRRQIQGAVAAYLLLAIAWAAAYEWMSLHDPSAFTGAGTSVAHPWTYYSLVTLTTMGYGDITPVHPAARSLAVAEALTGQLYVAILISRLVALELQARKS